MPTSRRSSAPWVLSRLQRALSVKSARMRLAISPPKCGAKSISTHIGFVPHDPSNPNYVAVREMVRRVCDYAAKHGQTLALETGQETAPVLLALFAT